MTMRNMIGNVGNFIGRAMETEKSQGRTNDDKRSAVQTVHVAVTQTPETNPRTPTRPGKNEEKTSTSLREKAKLLNMRFTTLLRNEKKLQKNVLT